MRAVVALPDQYFRLLQLTVFAVTILFADTTFADPGIDTRPQNLSCIAPPRPDPGNASLVESFPNLSVGGTLTIEFPPGDSSHLFAMHRDGRIFRFANDPTTSQRSTALDLRPLFAGTTEQGQSGLMDIAFHPDFANNGYLYVAYTVPGDERRSYLARYTSSDGGVTFSTNAEPILSLRQYGNFHNIGTVFFGIDGYLYVGFGDGGASNQVQDPSTWYGKILRIDVDGGTPYSIPADNPYATGGGAPEVFAMGLRNPWRVSQDSGGTGEIWAGDVGAADWEEVNLIESNANYGWPIMEGARCRNAGCDESGFTDPVHEYSHDNGCAVIGGHVYRGSLFPSLVGKYIFSDVCTGDISSLDNSGSTAVVESVLNSGLNIRDFSIAPDGELLVIAGSSSRLLKLVPESGGGAPQAGFPATLSATGCVDPSNPTEVSDGVIPYKVNTQLWSDGAAKRRWLAIPDGSQIGVQPDGDWDFPPGSVLIKEFSWNGSPFETRLMVRHDDGGWTGYTYEWNDSLTDADLVPASGLDKQIDGQLDWTYPSSAQCMQCHSVAAGRSLGLETAQLNGPLLYPSGITSNQLETLAHIGLFANSLGGQPADLPALKALDEDSATLNDRSRSYLHANCSLCHRPGGLGQGDMDFRFQTAFEDANLCNAEPQISDLGVPGSTILTPGNPASSVMSLRMHATNADRMPPLGTRLVDIAGTQVIDDWIRSLSGCSVTQIPVPDLIGQTRAAAELVVTSSNLEVGALSTAPDNSAPVDTVIGQNPAAGTLVTAGSFVDVTLSSGLGGATNTFPSLMITAPASGSSFFTGDNILFSADADDPEDGDLTTDITWSSDLAGPNPLATGGSFQTTGLGTGVHTITASVTDSSFATMTRDTIVTITDPGVETQANLPSVADAFTRNAGNAADTNYGGRTFMRVEVGGAKASFVRFDMSFVTGPVSSAILNMSIDSVDRDGSVSVHSVLGSWSESTITHNNQPLSELAATASFPVASGNTNVQVDITALVSAWQMNPAGEFGLVLRHAGRTEVTFDTRESGNAPTLDIVYGGGRPGPVNTPPTVGISNPADNTNVTTGSTVLFEASASDSEEGDLSSSIQWNSNRDGFLGAGQSISIATLNLGAHVITASVTDLGGVGITSTDSINIGISDPGGQSAFDIAASADTFTRDAGSAADSNYGTRSYMRVENGGSKASFVSFDTSVLGNSVSSAVLKLTVNSVASAGIVTVHDVQGTWGELSLTHNNQPPSDPAAAASFSVSESDLGREIQVDVTSLVAAWQANPSANHGLVLRHFGRTRVSFDTRETSSNPLLSVVTATGGSGNTAPDVQINSPGNNDTFAVGETVAFAATAIDDQEGDLTSSLTWESSIDGAIGGGGSFSTAVLTPGTHSVTASVTDSGGSGLTGTASVTFFITSPGGGGQAVLPATADSFVRDASGAADSNYGTRSHMRVENAGPKASFVRFDTSSLPGPVSSAILNISVDDVSRAGSVTVHAVLGDWTELGITHNNQPLTDPVAIASIAVSPSDGGSVLQIDVTGIVAQWQSNPATDFGLVLRHFGRTLSSFDTRESAAGPFIEVTTN